MKRSGRIFNWLSGPETVVAWCWRAATVLAVAGLVGCGKKDVEVYRVPKESAPPSAPANLPPKHPDLGAQPAGRALEWKTPPGWKEIVPSSMRVASFQVAGADGKQADVSVIPLAGEAGGELGNVNRWRGQVGQPPVTAEELKSLAQPVEIGGAAAELYEQSGANPDGQATRILAALQRRGGTAWFFKMTGDSQLVAQQKPVFVQFLRSVRFVPEAQH